MNRHGKTLTLIFLSSFALASQKNISKSPKYLQVPEWKKAFESKREAELLFKLAELSKLHPFKKLQTSSQDPQKVAMDAIIKQLAVISHMSSGRDKQNQKGSV